MQIDNTGPAAGPPTPESAGEFVAKTEAPFAPPEPPEPPEPPASIEVKVDEMSPVAEESDEPQATSQLEVLQMVERGEITVEEAVKLLGG